MKKIIVLFAVILLFGCDDDTVSYNNPYLPNYSVNFTINLTLPYYSALNFAGNAVYVSTAGVGIRGIFVLNTGNGYTAFDAACPNQPLSDCSTMQLNGIMAICPCDDAQYSLYTGIAEGKNYTLKPYRVEVNENILRIYN